MARTSDYVSRVEELEAAISMQPPGSDLHREFTDELRVLRDEEIRDAVADPNRSERSTYEERPHEWVSGWRGEALRANANEEFLPERAREYMERELRADDDPEQRLARLVTVLSDRDYFRAFAAWLRDPVSGGHEWTPRERGAVQRVKWVDRAMSLSGSAGGFLVPYSLDPSILISSTGYVDPMRSISRVTTSAYNTKKFVTSLGVTSHWFAEGAEVTDNSPTLVQPSIDCKKAMAFVPLSFELFEDSDIAQQIGHVFADSKASEEARVFTTGVTASNEPNGIITALVAAGGGTVLATGTNVLAQGDLYTNQASLPPRWRHNAHWMMNLSILNGFRQLPQATGLNYSVVDDTGDHPKILGWYVAENSNMDATLSGGAADYAVVSGDFQQYAIVDRIGTTIEVIPNLMGAANRYPTGQRGILMHWRVGADVLIADAFRLSNYST